MILCNFFAVFYTYQIEREEWTFENKFSVGFIFYPVRPRFTHLHHMRLCPALLRITLQKHVVPQHVMPQQIVPQHVLPQFRKERNILFACYANTE